MPALSTNHAVCLPYGKYLLFDRIADGGMAEVFTAKSFGVHGFEKVLAIKRILPTISADPDFVHMFIDEAKIAGQLSHANICPIYELGQIEDSFYIAMEFVWGKDVLQIINRFRRTRNKMAPTMAAWIGYKVCEALAYAHRKTDSMGVPLNIVHRDISPQNILVSYEGEVKLIDFGISKAAIRTVQTQAGILKGKFGYMSPEQVRGDAVDARSDLFALGTCLYEMLTADRLFKAASEFATMERVRRADVPLLSSVLPGVPEDLSQIVMKALHERSDDRWQNALEMGNALRAFVSSQTTVFGSSHMADWMKAAFKEELSREKERLELLSQTSPGISISTSTTQAHSSSSIESKVPSASDDLHNEATRMVNQGSQPSADALPDAPTQIYFNSQPLPAPPPASISLDLAAEPTRIRESLDELGTFPTQIRSHAFFRAPPWLYWFGGACALAALYALQYC